MATIKDVAREANVSVSTVSKVLNNKVGVGNNSYQSVMEAVKKLNFRPNMYARNLKGGKASLFGLIVPSLSGIYTNICNGILKVMESQECHVIVKVTYDFKNREIKALNELAALGVSGIFLVACFQENVGAYDKIIDEGIPLLFIDRNVDDKDYSFVIFDNRNVTYNIYTHLLAEKGASSGEILLITGNTDYSSEKDCIRGAQIALDNCSPGSELFTKSVSLIPEQAFKELADFIPAGNRTFKYIVLSNDLILNSVKELFNLFAINGIEMFVLSGEQWDNFSEPPYIHYVNRNATKCGKRCAEIMLENLKIPSVFENVQEVLITHMPEYLFGSQPGISHAKADRALNLLLFKSPMADAIIKLLASYELHSGFKVTYEVYEQEELFDVIIERSKKGGGPIDIFMADLPWINRLEERRVILPLDQWAENVKDQFLPEIWEMFLGSNGSVYSIPIAYGLQFLIYRKDLFEDASLKRLYYDKFGIQLKVPRTWTEYNFIAKFFTREQNPSSPTLYGNCLLGGNPIGLTEEFLPRQWAFNGRIADKSGVVIHSMQNVRALKNLREAYTYSKPDIQGYNNDEHISNFLDGNAAMINSFNLMLKSVFDQRFSLVIDKVGYVSLPGKKSTIGAWGLSVSECSDMKEQALDLIGWLTSERLVTQSTILGGFAPQKSVCQNEQIMTIYPWNEDLQMFMADGRLMESVKSKRGGIIDNYVISQVIGNAVASCLYNDMSAELALGRAKDELEEIIAAY